MIYFSAVPSTIVALFDHAVSVLCPSQENQMMMMSPKCSPLTMMLEKSPMIGPRQTDAFGLYRTRCPRCTSPTCGGDPKIASPVLEELVPTSETCMPNAYSRTLSPLQLQGNDDDGCEVDALDCVG